MENIIHDPGKKIRWNLADGHATSGRRQRRKAKKEHGKIKEKARGLLVEERKRRKQERKQETRRELRASIVVDSAATSTVIRAEDVEHVELLPTRSTKVFYNANGTVSKAGQKAKLHYNLRETAKDADTVPSLALNSLLSTSKLADANYITIFTPDEVKVFDAEISKLHITGEAVMKGWRCPKTKLWRVPLKEQWQNVNTDTALLSKTVTNIIMEK